ncbi:CDP-glycerol glycerophosphotransferase family protein [uncultured Clostridium sp.]|uniref:CDP-glycerol glycerophosphotransferase family protein n=1 Tax=uncultured Clostridium sp. TaxID=59620 RepID=UPI00259105A3|nr:CDP-glycerol glycerophosphotransferase family protein [uncultured Clostridium sp.]
MDENVGHVEVINWNTKSNVLSLDGYAFINGKNINLDHKVKKSFMIKNKNNNKKYYIPAKNVFKPMITEEFGSEEFNYDYSGFSGNIDIGVIDNMTPLSEGTWEISIYINADGVKAEIPLEYIGKKQILEEKRIAKKEFGFIQSISLSIINGIITFTSKEEKVTLNEYSSIKNNRFKNLKKFKKYILKKKRKFGNKILSNLYKIFIRMKIKENRVTFLSDSRVDFSGNFQFVYDELNKRGGYEIKSILKESISAKRSLKEMILMTYYIATSRYVLLDDYYPQIYKFKIRDGVEVIQLWHATGAFKTFGFSRLGKKGGPKAKSKNHRNYTKAIVSSTDIKAHYSEAFGISEEKIISTGVPRTDIFFDEEYKNDIKKRLYSKYPNLKDKKIIMFAPTFRGNGQKTAYYDFYRFDIEALKERLGDEYKLIVKLHPFINDEFIIPENCKDFALDLSSEREINDLLFITDILITDYSSVCFEYSLLNKPMIFFAYDLEEYIASRDFYYPYESFVPGPIVRDTGGIIETIENEDFQIEKLEKFRTTFFDHFDGKSTERVVDELLKI